MKRSVSFDAIATGDCECFVWETSEKQRAAIVASHQLDKELGDRLDRVYPEEILNHLGAEPGKPYRFTVAIEELDQDARVKLLLAQHEETFEPGYFDGEITGQKKDC